MKRNTLIAQITLATFVCLAATHTSRAMFEALTGLDEPTYETVRLVSSDGKSFPLPKEVAFISEYVRTYLTGEFREAAGPTGVLTQRGMGDLPRTVHVDVPGQELNVLVQMMRLLHKHHANEKAQANAIARMPAITLKNIGALIRHADFLLLPESCITGLIDRLVELIRPATGFLERTAEFLHQVVGTSEVAEIPFDDPTLLTQLGRAYFLKYGQDLELADDEKKPVDIGGFSIRELLDAGRQFLIRQRSNRLVECDLENLRINSLEGLLDIPEIEKCNILFLANNQITSIQPGVFRGLPELLALNLLNNRISTIQISTIQPGMFQGLSDLANLNLNGNQITSIQPGSFQELTNLRSLSLNNNQIISIQPGTFQGLPNLWELNLNGNQITSIHPGMFQGLSNLFHLHLTDNQITSIEPGSFQGLSSLWMLYLFNNQLTSIQPGTFQRLPKLEKLVLFNNRLSADTVVRIREELPPNCKLEAENQREETPEEQRARLAEAAERRMQQQ